MYGRIRDAINKAAKQLHQYKGSPCVVVLHNDGSGLMFEPMFILGAMFGNQAIEVPLNEGEPKPVFGQGRMTAADKNTTVSAIAVLSITNADQGRIDETCGKATQLAGIRWGEV
jgi:hypothetical protein